jgi:hypothetical protein
MAPEALPTQARKASWKRWMIALACVLGIIAAALLLPAPIPEPARIWFVRATNVNGVKTLVFQGTNGTAGKVAFDAWFTTNLTASNRLKAIPADYEDAARQSILPGKSFTFSLVAPPKEPASRLMWCCSGPELEPKRWVRLRAECTAFFEEHGMPALAARFAPYSTGHILPASEIKE